MTKSRIKRNCEKNNRGYISLKSCPQNIKRLRVISVPDDKSLELEFSRVNLPDSTVKMLDELLLEDQEPLNFNSKCLIIKRINPYA